MPPSASPDPAALDWLDARLHALDEAPLIAALSDADVAGELRDLGLDVSALRPLPEASAPDELRGLPAAPRLDRMPERHPVARAAAPRAARQARWRTAVLAAVGLLALVVASTLVLRPPGEASSMEAAEMKASAPAPQGADAAPAPPAAATPAERTARQIARLRAFTAAWATASTASTEATSRDTAGVGAAIFDVRRAYDDAAAFESVSGRPLDPSLAADSLAALLRDAYTALNVPDSARAFARRLTP